MSCPYYYWNNHFACRKANKDVNEDTYYKYCRNYDYSDCPIYKGQVSSDSGGCFLSTACVITKGLPDNCEELQCLRNYRDTYMRETEERKKAVAHYYAVAPKIVAALSASANSHDLFAELYSVLVAPCVQLIKSGNYDDAYKLYKRITLSLEETYLEHT